MFQHTCPGVIPVKYACCIIIMEHIDMVHLIFLKNSICPCIVPGRSAESTVNEDSIKQF